MATLTARLRGWLNPESPKTLPAGIYHYQSPADDPRNYRLHLRIDPNGEGMLIINASTILHLNQTAAEYAYHLVNRMPADQIAEQVSARYRVSRDKAMKDYQAFQEKIETLINTPDLDPISYLDMDRQAPYSGELSAPYRLDCALTYRLPVGAPAQAAPAKRVERELSTEEWKSILNKAWEAGIPHVVFTGGEPTLRDDLVELVRYAEAKGIVTGLLTDGHKLADTSYLNSLLQAGLDHTMIILQPNEERTWASLASFTYWTETLNEDIFVAAHLTLTKENANDAAHMIDRLTEAGVSAISLSESDKSLSGALQTAREHADERNVNLVWDMPVPYSSLNPVALELEAAEDGEAPASGAGRGWLYVEPDGDVLPAQGVNKVLGNLARDEWGKVWAAARALSK